MKEANVNMAAGNDTLPENGKAKSMFTPEQNKLLQKTRETKGEKWFDAFLYGGIGYGANLILSVVVGYFFIKGKGKPIYDKVENWTENKLRPIMRDKWAEKIGHEATRIGFLGAGGHLVMVPVKYLEDNKKRFVYWLNSKFFPNEYAGMNVPIKPLSQMKDSDLPEVVEQPAEMSWGKTFVRRMFIYFGIAIGLAPFAKANKWAEGKLQAGMHKGIDLLQNGTKSKSLAAMQRNKVLHDYIEVGAADLYLSAASAVLVKLTNGAHGIFSKRNGHSKADEPQAPIPSETEVTSNEPVSKGFAETVKPREKIAAASAAHAENVAARRQTDTPSPVLG